MTTIGPVEAPIPRRTILHSSRVARLLLAVYFSLAPSSVPPHRLGPDLPPAAVLVLGEPVRALRG